MVAKTAIDAPRFDAFWVDPEALKLITDKASPFYQERAEEPPDEGLVLSMKSSGFLPGQAVMVFKDGSDLCVLDGRRRVIAAREANRQLKVEGKEPLKVSVILKRGTESDLYAVQCAANENRSDVSDVERAKELSKLMAYGRTEEQAGACLGLNVAKTKRVLSLLDCSAAVQKAVEAKKISTSAAAKLSKLPREQQTEQLEKVLAEGPTERSSRATVNKVDKAVKAAQGERTESPPSRKEVKAALKQALEDSDVEKGVIDALEWVVSGRLTEGWFKTWLKG